MDLIPVIFFVGLVFIVFFTLLSVFGFSILFLIKEIISKKKDENERKESSLSFLEQVFISFGLGVSVYICFCYLIDFFKLFNFYTSYLSIMIFDVIFLGYLIFRNREKLKSEYRISLVKRQLKDYFSNKNNVICLGSLIFIITLSIIIQLVIITDSNSLIYTDPYKWYQTTFYLLDNGHIDYEYLDYNYPSGHTFFNAGVLLVYPDYIFGYYYFKLISLYFLPLYIIIAYVIIRKLFKKNYLVFLALLFILVSRYFVARTMYYLSSSLATLVLVISLLIIINKYPDYIIGIFLAGMYLIHPLTTFYYIFVLIFFYIFKFLVLIKSREKFYKQIISIILLIGISLILLIPYFLGIYLIYNKTLLDFLEHFFGRFTDFEANLSQRSYKNQNSFLLNMVYPLEYFKPFIDKRFLGVFDEFFKKSIFHFFIFSVICLFIYIRPKKSKKDIETMAFFKCFIIIIIIFFFLPYFFYDLGFFTKFRDRILQGFSLVVIIMAVYAIEWIISKAKLITEYLTHKFEFYKKLINNKKPYSRLFRIDSIIVILLLVSASSTYYMNRWPDYDYRFDDELVDVVLYLRENAKPDSNILRQEFDSAIVFRMLYDMDIDEWDLTENSTYAELLMEVQQRNIDYLIFPKEFFDDGSIDYLVKHNPNFNEKLRNDDFILFKID